MWNEFISFIILELPFLKIQRFDDNLICKSWTLGLGLEEEDDLVGFLHGDELYGVDDARAVLELPHALVGVGDLAAGQRHDGHVLARLDPHERVALRHVLRREVALVHCVTRAYRTCAWRRRPGAS